MGVIAHHTIIVTGCYGDWLARAHAQALDLFDEDQVSPVSKAVTNGYQSFAVFPDGSKEGWAESDYGDEERGEFVAWLERQKYSDGSSPLAWVEVNYGETRMAKYGAEVTRSAYDRPTVPNEGGEPK